ncbi:MAG TPA: hypothetical protein VEC39_15915 [Vicinamibacterales bacterium]|nr:hypothetical protein [Vicinamibacterales bacterium]
MMRPLFRVFVLSVCAVMAACGDNAANNRDSGPPPAAPAPPSAPAPPTPATTVTLVEPADGAMSGHIDLFRWQPVDGADGYVITIKAVTGDRVVWESQPLTVTETKLPATVALEPEVHTWSVAARKGGQTLVTSPTYKFTITP